MDTLVNLLHSGFSNIAPFFILLGLLIFVHELGHFAVAKFFKVRVEVFSLGFGKKILQFNRGGTTYCISLIPLGGYVKMFGDDPTAEVEESQKKYAFLHKPVSQRIAIVLAGPLMNLFFAILLYFIIGMVGVDIPGTTLGDIAKDSHAYESGFRSGDVVKSVKIQNSAKKIMFWEDLTKVIEKSAESPLSFTVEREGMEQTVNSTPKLIANDQVLSTEEEVGRIRGLTYSSKAPVVGYVSESSAAHSSGFYPLSIIQKINNTEVFYFRNLDRIFKQELEKSDTLTFEIKEFIFEQEKAQSKSVTINKADLTDTTSVMTALQVESTELYLIKITKDSPALNAGVQFGDKILAINQKPISQWKQVVETIKSYDGKGPISLKVARIGGEKTLSLTPKMTEMTTSQGQDDKRYTVGIVPAFSQGKVPLVKKVFSNPVEALGFGVEKSWDVTKMIAIGLVRLVQGRVSKKNVGGVISIGVVATKSFKAGFTTFVNIMAVISINLFLLNLLPIPILDGGHLIFFGIEALRGAPISLKKMEMAQQVGLVILLGLMVFALFNDVNNIFNSPW